LLLTSLPAYILLTMSTEWMKNMNKTSVATAESLVHIEPAVVTLELRNSERHVSQLI